MRERSTEAHRRCASVECFAACSDLDVQSVDYDWGVAVATSMQYEFPSASAHTRTWARDRERRA
jgi:hypothetical protein